MAIKMRVLCYPENKKKLTAINKTLGRKFRVVSFKWLDAWDI